MMQKAPILLVALSTLVALTFSCHVHASVADDLVSTNEVTSHKVIGWGAVFMPEYIGAKKNRTGPAFFFEYVDANGFYISTLKGIGLSQRFEMV
jgi:outer membrane scaffolding protein for murein synthesis (MipA/OmpV family)